MKYVYSKVGESHLWKKVKTENRSNEFFLCKATYMTDTDSNGLFKLNIDTKTYVRA